MHDLSLKVFVYAAYGAISRISTRRTVREEAKAKAPLVPFPSVTRSLCGMTLILVFKHSRESGLYADGRRSSADRPHCARSVLWRSRCFSSPLTCARLWQNVGQSHVLDLTSEVSQHGCLGRRISTFLDVALAARMSRTCTYPVSFGRLDTHDHTSVLGRRAYEQR